MPNVKIFMSDLHIGGGGKEDDFSPVKEAKFCSVINALKEKYSRESELILLGDIFDLIEQVEDVEDAIKASVKKHKDAIIALQDWLISGRKIFYITGNHDHAIRQPHISDYLAKKLIGKNNVPWGNFVVDDWYASKSFRLYAEHGNRFDADNNHAGEEMCFGDRIVKELLRLLESGENGRYSTDKKWQDPWGLGVTNPFEFLDNARPRGNIILLIERLIDEEYLTEDSKKDLKKRILDLYEQNPNASALKKFLLNNLRWLISDGQVRSALDDHYLPYRNNARAMMDEFNDHNIFKLRDLSYKPKFLVMGHTHFFDECRASKDCTYINLSSWLDTIYIDKKGKLADVMKNCPFLVFEKRGRAIKQTMYDASKNKPLEKPLDWELLKKNRKKYGIPTTDHPFEE
ncbi:MAG TPA: metallophosphoesterase [Desulfobacterales bacterium]|nr:metallophosphoesterase [Desulfobacterales bacterium]